MDTAQAADMFFNGQGPSFGWEPMGAVSEPVAEVIDLRGVPRAKLVIDPAGRKRLIYEKGSLWAFPPTDLGPIRSDRLDEVLYGGG
jgi:hypothetical protein